MREFLRADRFPCFDFKADGDVIRELAPDELVRALVREREDSVDANSVIVAFTNASTRAYNDAIRQRLFPGVRSVTTGDQIIIVRNNYNYERPLLNGQMGKVLYRSSS